MPWHATLAARLRPGALDPQRHARSTEPDEEQRASSLELFFDLVYVLAITQLSSYLSSDLGAGGAVRCLLLLLVVWWGWGYTTWMTNWLDPDSARVRVLLMGLSLASLLMAVAIPRAFGADGLLFAGSYLVLQVGRNVFTVRAAPDEQQLDSLSRILVWSLAAAPLWLAGALVAGHTREWLWVAALVLEYAAPLVGYWLPLAGRVATTDWSVEGAHFAERFQLLVIIALGETIVVTGATAGHFAVDAARTAAVALSFLVAAALWWLYFDFVAPISTMRLSRADDPGSLARDGYTYLHLPLVAGIVAVAVGEKSLIAHPTRALDGWHLAMLAGGPVLYLLGHVAFRLRMAGSLSRKRLGAAVAVSAAGALGPVLPALATAALVVVVLVVLIAAELASVRRRRADGRLGPLERELLETG